MKALGVDGRISRRVETSRGDRDANLPSIKSMVESQEGLKPIPPAYVVGVVEQYEGRISRRVETRPADTLSGRLSKPGRRISRRVETTFENTTGSKPSLRILLCIHRRKVSADQSCKMAEMTPRGNVEQRVL